MYYRMHTSRDFYFFTEAINIYKSSVFDLFIWLFFYF